MTYTRRLLKSAGSLAPTLRLGGPGPLLALPLALALSACQQGEQPNTRYELRVTLHNAGNTLTTSAGPVGLAFAPGLWLVHEEGEPLYSEGASDRGEGLEALAEDGNPEVLDANLASMDGYVMGQRFEFPADAYEQGALHPAEKLSFEIVAEPGQRLSLVGMFVQSNDIFFGFDPDGLLLVNEDGELVAEGVVEGLSLWDAGTEVNQEPGVGEDQAPRQSGPDTGADEDGVVHRVDDGFEYPALGEVLRVEIERI